MWLETTWQSITTAKYFKTPYKRNKKIDLKNDKLNLYQFHASFCIELIFTTISSVQKTLLVICELICMMYITELNKTAQNIKPFNYNFLFDRRSIHTQLEIKLAPSIKHLFKSSIKTCFK